MVTLTTERLILRTARPDDITGMFSVFSNTSAMRYWDSLPHTDPSQTAGFLAAMCDADPRLSADFIVELNGMPIGKAGFWRMPEIGYILHPDHWGQGYATEFMSVLIRYGFETQKLPKITADVDPRNEASIRLLAKFGFTETGRETANLLVGDQWCDSVYFALTNQS